MLVATSASSLSTIAARTVPSDRHSYVALLYAGASPQYSPLAVRLSFCPASQLSIL